MALSGVIRLPLGRLFSLLPRESRCWRATTGARDVHRLGTICGDVNGRLHSRGGVHICTEATPELCRFGWCRPSGRRYPPRERFAVHTMRWESKRRWSCSEVHTIAEVDGRHVAREAPVNNRSALGPSS